jgi:hypothetical protein
MSAHTYIPAIYLIVLVYQEIGAEMSGNLSAPCVWRPLAGKFAPQIP